MRKIYLFAAAAAMFAACSSDKLETPAPPQPELKEIAVGFDAYTQRGVTRSGNTGTLVTNGAGVGQIDLETVGFGVFGYYTDLNEYDQLYTPNFMYNQKVSTAGWTYSPVKYWPNEYGTSALSDDVDKVSFFAYAPYVDVTPTSGKVDANENTWGITGMTKNSATGDPIIKYVCSSANPVDLCWGVVGATNTWAKINGTQTMPIGLPWLNVERPATTDQKMKFTFQHALAQLNVKIDAAIDELTPATNELDSKTKIYVRNISFTGIAQKGALNLNNTTSNKALWLNYNGTDELDSGDAVTIHDGLKDGKEGTGQVATNEKSLGLNPDVISNLGNTSPGVEKTAKDLFQFGTAYVIPTGESMTVTITYDVETADDNLAGYLSDGATHGSSIQNVISKEVHFGGTNDYLENGKKYTLNLHLGMNSVKFEAEVADWQDDAVRDVHLPFNALSFASGSNGTVNIDAADTNAEFYITGQDKSADATVVESVGTLGLTASTVDNTLRATYGITKVTPQGITANTTTSKKEGSITVTDAAGAVSVVTITQAAHALGLELASYATNVFTFTVDPALTDITALDASGVTVQVKKNGTDLVGGGTDYSITTTDLTLTLTSAPSLGDKFVFIVKANDADAVTINYTVE